MPLLLDLIPLGLRQIPEVDALRIHGVAAAVHQVVDLEAILLAALQVQSAVGEDHADAAVLGTVILDAGLGVVNLVRLGKGIAAYHVFGGDVLLVPGKAELVEAEAIVQGVGQLVQGFVLGIAGGLIPLIKHGPQALVSGIGTGVNDVLGDVEVDVGGRLGVTCVRDRAEGLLHCGRIAIPGVDGDFLDGVGIVAVGSGVVLGYVVEIVVALRFQAGDVDDAVDVFPGSDLAGFSTLVDDHAGTDVELGVLTGQRGRVEPGARLSRRIGLPLGDGHPVDRTVLIEPEVQAHRGILDDGGLSAGIYDELRRRFVIGDKGDAGDAGLVDAVRIGEEEVDHVGGLLLQKLVVHAEGTLGVLGHVPHAVAQRAGNGASLQFVLRGSHRPLGQQGIVELAVLIGHDYYDAVLGRDLGHAGIACVEGGLGVVRSGEGDNLGGAALVTGVYQHGGEVVGRAGSQAGNLRKEFLVALGGFDTAPGHGDAAVRRGLDEVLLAYGTVSNGADGPVDRSALVGHEHGIQAGGNNIPGLGIAGQNHGGLGGFLRRYGIHLLTVDLGSDARADDDLVGQHLHHAAGGIDLQPGDVALAGDLHGGIQNQVLDNRATVNNHIGAHGGLVHRQLGHGPLGGMNRGVGGAVDNLLNPARQGQLGRHPVLGLLALGVALALQGNHMKSQALGGIVLDIGAGAHSGIANLGDAVGPDGNFVILEIIHQKLVGGDVAQQDAGPALAGAGAAGNDPAQNSDVLQLYAAQPNAAGDVQIAADHGIPQGHPGRGDGHVPEGAAQGVIAGLLEGRADESGNHGGHLAPAHVPLGTEGAVVIAAYQIVFQGGLDGALGPGADVPGIDEVQNFTRRVLEHHVPPQNGGGRLPGQGVLGGGGGGRGALDVPGGIGNAHVVIVPVGFLDILKGGHAGGFIAVGAVNDAHEVRPGQSPVGIRRLGLVDDAPLHKLTEVGVRPVGRRLGGGEHGDQPQHHHRGQKKGQRPPHMDAAGGSLYLLH